MTTFFLLFFQWIIYFFSVKVLIKEKKINVREAIILVTMGTLLGCLYQYIGIFTALIIFFLLFYILYKEKMYSIKKSIILTSLTMIIMTLSDHITSFIGNLLFAENFHTDQILMLYHLPLTAILSIFFSFTIMKYTKRFREKINQNEKLQTALMNINVLILTSFYGSIMLERYIGDTIELIELNLFFFFVYAGISIVIFSFYAKSLEVKYQAQKKENEYQAMMYYVNEIEKQYTEMRKFKHDYQNILSSLDSFIEEEDYGNLREYYLEKIKVVSENFTINDFRLENLNRIKIKEIKSVLATKLMMAQSSGINAEFEAKEDIDFIPVDSVVLVRIMGILLDNAIEELMELKKGKLLVGILKDDNTITFIVQNTCRSKIPKVHQLKQSGFSTKGKSRGLGLSNLSDFVREHTNVSLETTIIENEFIQKVIIGG